MDISQKLQERHGITGSLGRKTTCPKCQSKTLQLFAHGQNAYCFHPGCGFWLGIGADSKEEKTSPISLLSEELIEIQREWHNALLTQKKTAAYQYLIERGISPKVIEAAPIGMVTDVDYNKYFTSETTQKFRERFEKMTQHATGALAFFFQDQFQRVVSFQLRTPGTKDFWTYKPHEHIGLFAWSMFLQNPQADKPDREYLKPICTEGAFNTLQLQTLLVKLGYPFAPACSYGGPSTADLECIHAISKSPYFWYDNDPNDAGFGIVGRAVKIMDLKAVRNPDPTNDLDEYIRSFGNPRDALNGIRKTLKTAWYFNYNENGFSNEWDRFFNVGSSGAKKFIPKRLGDEIDRKYHIMSVNESLWRYIGGVYRNNAESELKKYVVNTLDEAWALRIERETLGYCGGR